MLKFTVGIQYQKVLFDFNTIIYEMAFHLYIRIPLFKQFILMSLQTHMAFMEVSINYYTGHSFLFNVNMGEGSKYEKKHNNCPCALLQAFFKSEYKLFLF